MIASTDDSAGAGPSPTEVPTSGSDCSTPWPGEDEIFKRFTPQLNSLAARLCHGNPHLREELVQEGAVGLVHAMRRFDPRRGTQLSTLAQRYMRGRMLNFIRGQRRHSCCIPLQEACWPPDTED